MLTKHWRVEVSCYRVFTWGEKSLRPVKLAALHFDSSPHAITPEWSLGLIGNASGRTLRKGFYAKESRWDENMPIQHRTDTSAAEHNLRKSWPFAPNPVQFRRLHEVFCGPQLCPVANGVI